MTVLGASLLPREQFIISMTLHVYILDNIDRSALQELFDEYDKDRDGSISVVELEKMLVELGVAPMKDPSQQGSASSDKIREERKE